MKKTRLVCALIAALTLMLGAAQAGTLTFNDLATPNHAAGAADWGIVPSSYAGLTWDGWEVINGQQFNGIYGGNVFHGGYPNNAVYNGGDGNLTVTTSAGTPFSIFSAQFSFWPGVGGYASDTVTVTGYLGNAEVGSHNVVLSSGFKETDLGFAKVDRVTFTSSAAGRYWLMDNVNTTPEPGTLGLIAAGLLGLGFRLRRKVIR